MNAIKFLKKMKEIELKNYKKDIKNGIPVRINPKSYAVKELEYQTVLLKEIKHDLDDIKMLLQKRSNIS